MTESRTPYILSDMTAELDAGDCPVRIGRQMGKTR